MIDSSRLVFIGGLHRSGTTLLGRLIADHPDASGFADTGVPADEGQHLQTLYPPAKRYGGPGRFAFAADAHLTEESELVSTEAAEHLLADWSAHWDTSRARLVEKSPPNLIRFRFLQALYPDASFIAVVRHPIAVAYATQKWSRTSIPSLLEHWVVAHECFSTDAEQLGRLRRVSYEHLVNAPGSTMEDVYSFLGLTPHQPTVAVDPGANERYLGMWRDDRRRLTRRLRLDRAARRLEPRTRELGYSLIDVPADGSPAS